MKPLLAALLLLSAALPATAAEGDEPRPNTLTPKEIAEGWILLFDGETTFGWQATNESKWTIAEGMLAPQEGKVGALVTTAVFNDYEVRLEYKAKKGGFPQVVISPGTDVQLTKYDEEQGTLPPRRADEPHREVCPLLPRGTGWNRLRLVVEGGRVLVKESAGGGSTKGTPSIPRQGTSHVALAGSGFVVRNVKLRPLGEKSVFNGKDLSGWKEIPDKKSKFTVTEDGALNIKNGPGDIQTEGQWADFVLQLEIFSNGKSLNSGVFFRCLPGEFWSGYEAQVRNQWQGDDRSKPVDYGTGGLYNRQPARKVVSSDKEWFTMTVAAAGPHIAIWVNGYQTVDYTDKRPPNKSARNGTKTDAGPLSLQGHDPTTDLSFRNIRIAELPGAGK
jgi:hypothetical protein